MGKGYVENSLKRFLKRKVKITLGVVVSFLITGMVAFSNELQEEPIIKGDKGYIPYNVWTQGAGKTEEILKNDIVWDGQMILKTSDIKELSKDIGGETKEIIKTSSLLWKNSVNAGNSGNDYTISGELFEDNGNYLAGLSYSGDNIIEAGETKGEFSNEAWIDGSNIFRAGQVAKAEEIAVNKGIITGGKAPDSTPGAFGIGQYAEGINAKIYNYGIIKTSNNDGQRAREGAEAYNYGIIINNKGQSSVDSFGYNYGIIAGNGVGQSASIKTGIESHVYNYGIIITEVNKGQHGSYLIKDYNKDEQKGINLGNYGLIANKGEYGQICETRGYLKAYNYGTIANGNNKGQVVSFSQGNNSYGELYNYGIIANKGDYGQVFENSYGEGIIVNYGIIANEGNYGQSLGQADGKGASSEGIKSYNYGIIANTGKYGIYTAENGTSYNYGVIANKVGEAFGISGTIKSASNDGIVINNSGYFVNHDGDNVKNNGVVIVKNEGLGLNDNYKLKNNGVEIDASTNNIKISIVGDNMLVATNQNDNVVTADKKFDSSKDLENNKNLFVDRYTTNGKLTGTVTLTNTELKGNHITTVLGDTTDKAVISTKDDLTLTDSSIVGYFQNAGTLLTVNGNLILKGESVINAVAGDGVTDVVAVKLENKGTLEIGENSKVLGAVKGEGTALLNNSKGHHNNGYDVTKLDIKTTEEKGTETTIDNLKVSEGVIITGDKTSTDNTKITFGNNINITGGLEVVEVGTTGNLGADITLGDGQASSDKTINIDSITLGTGDDILTINNVLEKVGVIDGNKGNDTVNLKISAGDTFDYKLNNIETLDLNNHTWKIGANANISHDTTTKAGEKTTIQNGTLMGELKGTAEKGVEFVNKDNVNNVLENSTFGDNAKFQMNIGKDMKLEAGAEYNLDDTTKNNLENIKDNIVTSAIFTKATEQGKDIRVKSAKEMNIDERYSGIYEEMLKNASSNSEILDTLNESDVSSIANAINGKGVLGDTLATTGYKITRDISNSFMSAVNEWGKKANKGEWLTNAKYISSDVEYDGANNVKGYDSDINSMVGMIEYGVSENTAYGIALGGGDTEIDVKDAGTLKGDNYYIGAYAKHSVNRFDLVGNLGYTISDLEVNGEGSADSSAITFGGYIKKNVALTETVRIEPNFSFTYDYIMQDNGEGNGVKVDNKDIHVFEASAGMNIVKGFNLETGVLELKAGAKYSMADINRNEETVISVYGIDDINLGNPEVDKTRGTANIGFDYEHNSGFGVNGKYEMMWSDSGDDSRITAGISYRF